MKYKNILITGGAGFVGSNLSLKLKKKYPETNIIALDNLKRRGSELNLPRFKEMGINFIHGDVRKKSDLFALDEIDLIIECSAEPSVLAGSSGSPDYLLDTNLMGALNCLELARLKKADFIFLSTSRVYSVSDLEKINFLEEDSRFTISPNQEVVGVSERGINENFPVNGYRSLYGATKLTAEYFLQEYIQSYGIKGVINRCGVICGPWQMGKIDQGVAVLWLANHYFKKELSYIGFNGGGKQVRDFLDIDDLFDLIDLEISDINKFNGKTFNVGGSLKNSLSLLELTALCQDITGNKIEIGSIEKTRYADIKSYVTDNNLINSFSSWTPKKTLKESFEEIFNWVHDNEKDLKNILG